jgi:hypothetical protein
MKIILKNYIYYKLFMLIDIVPEKIVTFMAFYHGAEHRFSIGRINDIGEILFTDIKNNIIYRDISNDNDSLKTIFSFYGFDVKQNDLDLYDSDDTYEMITLPLDLLFEKMDLRYGYNVEIIPLPVN